MNKKRQKCSAEVQAKNKTFSQTFTKKPVKDTKTVLTMSLRHAIQKAYVRF